MNMNHHHNDNNHFEEECKSSSHLARGDAWAVNEHYHEAIKEYSDGLSRVTRIKEQHQSPPPPPPPPLRPQQPHVDETENENENIRVSWEEGCVMGREFFRLMSHRSAAFVKLERFVEAESDAKTALAYLRAIDTTTSTTTDTTGAKTTTKPNHHTTTEFCLRVGEATRAKLRYAQVLWALGQIEESEVAYRRAASEDPFLVSRDYGVHQLDDPFIHIYKTLREMYKTGMQAIQNHRLEETEKSTAANTEKEKQIESAAHALQQQQQLSMSRRSPPTYQYYQTDSVLTIALLEPHVQAHQLHVQFPDAQTLRITLNTVDNIEYVIVSGHLYGSVRVEECKTVIKSDKVLIKLKKDTPQSEWYSLLDESNEAKKKQQQQKTPTIPTTKVEAANPQSQPKEEVKVETTASTNDSSHCHPTASTTESAIPNTAATAIPHPYASTKNWNQIERDIEQEDENTKKEGDAAAMQLFQQIYRNANEDTRRAMIKSYQTSGGTVLSTNWEDVKQTDYENERTAPEGQEWKTWEGQKLKSSSPKQKRNEKRDK